MFWNFLFVSMVFTQFLDAYPGRRAVAAAFGVGALTMFVAVGVAYFSLYQIEHTDEPFLGGRVNSRNRLLAQLVYMLIYCIRFFSLALRHPHRFVTIPGLELCRVSRAEAFTLLHVGQRSQSHMTRSRVAPSPARPDAGSVLEQVTSALRAVSARSGPELRRELELLCRECADDGGIRRRSLDIADELRLGTHESSAVVMLLPVFQTTVVDENDSLGAALLHARAPGPDSLVSVLAQCASWPLSFALTVSALLGSTPAWAALAITSLSALSSARRLLQGSTAILRLLVRRFEVWLAFGYAVFAAASGCVALATTPDLALLWCLSQVLLPLVLLHDSLPASCGVVGLVHRRSFFPVYLIFCAACIGLLHTERFPGSGEVIHLLGVAQSPTQSCLSAHFLLFFFALRYVYRIIRSNDGLVSIGGLRKTRLALTDAHDLRSAQSNVRSKSKHYSFGKSLQVAAKVISRQAVVPAPARRLGTA